MRASSLFLPGAALSLFGIVTDAGLMPAWFDRDKHIQEVRLPNKCSMSIGSNRIFLHTSGSAAWNPFGCC
jgi:hypothetical protein